MLNTPADVEATEDVDILIREGLAAAERNDKTTARAALRKAVRLDANNVAALLGLARVVGTTTERRNTYQRVLELEPTNAAATEALAALDRPAAAATPVSAAPLRPEETIMPATELETCYRHPNRETGLHCIQCSRPICSACASASPVGYLCPECRKQRRSPQYQIAPLDAVKAGLAGVVVGALAVVLAGIVGGVGFFFYFFLFGGLAAALGEGVMRVINWSTNKRGPVIQAAALGGVLVGMLALSVVFTPSILPLIIFFAVIAATLRTRLR